MVAAIAQLVERLHGKEEVPGSNPGRGSLERAWRDSSVGQSARLIFVMSGGQIPPPLPILLFKKLNFFVTNFINEFIN